MITCSPRTPKRLTPPKPLILKPELNQGLLEVMGGGGSNENGSALAPS